MTGLAVHWDGSVYWIVYSDGYALHLATCNSNATIWTAMQDIAPATGTAITRLSPRIAYFDGIYNLICVEADSGYLTGTVYSYIRDCGNDQILFTGLTAFPGRFWAKADSEGKQEVGRERICWTRPMMGPLLLLLSKPSVGADVPSVVHVRA